MKIAMISLILLGATGFSPTTHMDREEAAEPLLPPQNNAQENTDADELYDLVKQARAELREMRVKAGFSAYPAGPQAGKQGSREGGEALGEHSGGEGRGEGGEHGGRAETGEEGGAYVPKMTKQNELFANGAHLVLEFNFGTQVFVGSVTNTTGTTLPEVRVEVHLDNGAELGPTRRIDVQPGQTIPVELGTFGNEFSSWVSHPEAGVEQSHGAGGEEGGEGRGEHGGRGGEGGEAGEHGGLGRGREGGRPLDVSYRPLYNQLQILRGEMHAFEVDLKARSG